MTVSFTDQLCANCGLCCDGTFLDDVELKDDNEATGLELMGLELDTDTEPVLLLPCQALDGTRCQIYPFRPHTCRRFECKLLHRATQGDVSVPDAIRVITKAQQQAKTVRSLCEELEEDPLQGSLRDKVRSVFENRDNSSHPDNPRYETLSLETGRLKALVDEHFLDS